MFSLGINQHARQLTFSLRDEQGDVVQGRQVSTQPETIEEFFERLKREFFRYGESFLAVVGVCGLHDRQRQWLGDPFPNSIEALSIPNHPRDLRCYRRPLAGLEALAR